jgi:lipoprotein-releasing system permease protein
MAFRYLRAHKIIYFSITGVALGILTLVVVTSIMGGFARDMRARIRGMQTHIVVSSIDRSLWFKDYLELSAAIEKIPHVVACAPRIEYEAWMGRRGIRRDVHLVGILPEMERRVSDLEAYFRQGGKQEFSFKHDSGREPEAPGAVLGAELWNSSGASLMTARDASTPILCLRDFESVGRFKSGMAEYDANYVFIHLSEAQAFLKLDEPPMANSLGVAVDDYDRFGRQVRQDVIRVLHERHPCADGFHEFGQCGKFRTQLWEQTKSILLQAVEVERGIMMIILFLIVVVAAFNIASIYTLVVRSKSRDIGILMALGGTRDGVVTVFLVSGGLCGLIGSLFGIGLGLLLSYNVNAVADFIRVVSREENALPRGELALAAGALLAAGLALIWSWLVLYKERRRHPWVRMGAALIALMAGAWFATSWLPGYEPRAAHDPALSPGARPAFVVGVGVLWIVVAALWRLMDRWRRYPGWIFFGFAWTMVFLAKALAIAGALAVAVAILAMQPAPGWRGLELFPGNIYYLDRIPIYVDGTGIAVIVVLTLLVSVVFSIYPALRAAAANPIEAIRDE